MWHWQCCGIILCDTDSAAVLYYVTLTVLQYYIMWHWQCCSIILCDTDSAAVLYYVVTYRTCDWHHTTLHGGNKYRTGYRDSAVNMWYRLFVTYKARNEVQYKGCSTVSWWSVLCVIDCSVSCVSPGITLLTRWWVKKTTITCDPQTLQLAGGHTWFTHGDGPLWPPYGTHSYRTHNDHCGHITRGLLCLL